MALVSFDGKSLFTSILIDMPLTVEKERLKNGAPSQLFRRRFSKEQSNSCSQHKSNSQMEPINLRKLRGYRTAFSPDNIIELLSLLFEFN